MLHTGLRKFNGETRYEHYVGKKDESPYDFLDKLGIEYLRTDHGPANNMEACNEIDEVQLLIDEDVLKGEDLGCHPCVCTSSLKMKTRDVIEKFLPATGHEYRTVHLVGEA